MNSPANKLITELQGIVGRRQVLTHPDQMRRFTTGYRYGSGKALAVARPGTLLEQWRVLEACVAAGVAIVMQAANTGLTGGSTPDGDDYDRDLVVINTRRLKGIQLLKDGQQVVCLPGATLWELETRLAAVDREPHSVIGSSCIGASVHGGVCNNSGGALIQRGPAYTELSLFAGVDAEGRLVLTNHLGFELGASPEEILTRLEAGVFGDDDFEFTSDRHASDPGYHQHVREVDAPTPARFNADPRRLSEASGCAGKLALFAVRLDTFPKAPDASVFYVGTNNAADLTHIRREVLQTSPDLPVSGEYIHQRAFEIAERYGKDTFLAIELLGTKRLPFLFQFKSWIDSMAAKTRILPDHFSDILLQGLSRLAPSPLPPRMRDYGARYQHHLMIKADSVCAQHLRALLSGLFPSNDGDFFECTASEGAKAFLHRFAVASAAVRYRAIHRAEVEDIVALDIALPRNTLDWVEVLPAELEDGMVEKLYYGHFFCHVFHQDYIVRKGLDPRQIEHALLKTLDVRGAKYPAEHNVGHCYVADPDLAAFYRTLDPKNQFNPGVGMTSKLRDWSAAPVSE